MEGGHRLYPHLAQSHPSHPPTYDPVALSLTQGSRELFFSGADGRQMFVVPLQSRTTLVAGRPQVLFDAMAVNIAGMRPYDIAHDGRFLISPSGEEEAADSGGLALSLVLVQNWTEELERLVPTN